MRRGQLRGHLELRSEELSARDRFGAIDTSTEASRGAINTPHGDIRRLVRERRARVASAKRAQDLSKALLRLCRVGVHGWSSVRRGTRLRSGEKTENGFF